MKANGGNFRRGERAENKVDSVDLDNIIIERGLEGGKEEGEWIRARRGAVGHPPRPLGLSERAPRGSRIGESDGRISTESLGAKCKTPGGRRGRDAWRPGVLLALLSSLSFFACRFSRRLRRS